MGYILERKANNSLLGLDGIEGTTFALEDSVNFAQPELYKVINIGEDSPGVFSIQGMQYDSGKFENIEKNTSLNPPREPVIFTEAPLAAPSNVSISALFQDSAYALVATWDSVEGAVGYRVQFLEENTLLASFYIDDDKSGEEQSFTYKGNKIVELGNYYARIYALST